MTENIFHERGDLYLVHPSHGWLAESSVAD
jgi:hypothetical protein